MQINSGYFPNYSIYSSKPNINFTSLQDTVSVDSNSNNAKELKKENQKLQKQINELKAENGKLKKQNMEMQENNRKMEKRLKELDTLSKKIRMPA